jgi:glyoxylase-like metal-dependent hydrolase (beta-lactamase superfamily II)
MRIETLVVGQLQTNCYLVWDEKTEEGIIIDPGDDAEYIINKLRDFNIKPVAILATHGHFDHLLAVNELKMAYKIPFMLHKKDLSLLGRTRESARYFTGLDVGPAPKVDIFLKNKDQIKFGQEKLQVLETPGHSPGGVGFYSKDRGVLFSGDTIFQGSVGRTDFSYSSETDLLKSIKKIFKLPLDTRILPGHGPETTIEEEKENFKQEFLQDE